MCVHELGSGWCVFCPVYVADSFPEMCLLFKQKNSSTQHTYMFEYLQLFIYQNYICVFHSIVQLLRQPSIPPNVESTDHWIKSVQILVADRARHVQFAR